MIKSLVAAIITAILDLWRINADKKTIDDKSKSQEVIARVDRGTARAISSRLRNKASNRR